MDDAKTKVDTKPAHSLPANSEKIRAFIKALLDGKSAADAADEAGYHRRAIGGLLRRRDVLKAIHDENHARNKVLAHTPAQIEARIGALAFSDISALFDDNLRLKPLHSVDRDTRAAIAAVNVQEFVDPDGKVSRRLYKVQMEKKTEPLALLSKINGLTRDEQTVAAVGQMFSVNLHFTHSPEQEQKRLAVQRLHEQAVSAAKSRPATIETTSSMPPKDEPRN